MKSIPLVSACILFSMVLGACQQAIVPETIVGTWKYDEGCCLPQDERFLFLTNGDIVSNGEHIGQYRLTEPNIVEIERGGNVQTYEASYDQGQFTLARRSDSALHTIFVKVE